MVKDLKQIQNSPSRTKRWELLGTLNLKRGLGAAYHAEEQKG